jgi:UDP-N-acetyl-D-mannosaminuronic acid dehydrogenase
MGKSLCVIGLGYIGLPTSLIFANCGFDVTGVDTNPQIVETLSNGSVHIKEQGLDEMYAEVRKKLTFRAQTRPCLADTFIIAVPTPILSNHKADLSYVVSAVQAIIPYLRKGNLIVIESTIPPRTTEDIVASVLFQANLHVGIDIFLAHCPERVLPGKILVEIVENNRIIGGYDPKSAEMAADLYGTFVTGEIIITSATTAEMAKLMENTFRDINIAIANELAKLSADIGINALEVIELANKHPRVHLHTPGPGVGGHCIAVDPYFIIEKSPDFSPLIQASRKINNSMPAFVVEQVEKITAQTKKRVTVFGITYKGNVDDVRESPALEVISLLKQKGYVVKAYDPHVKHKKINNLRLYDVKEALEHSNCLIILADHKEFRQLNEQLVVDKMNQPIILDTKNVLNSVTHDSIKLYNYGNLYKLNNQRGLAQSMKEIAASKQ